MIRYMSCTTCKDTVVVNNTGTCLKCQKGFGFKKDKDEWTQMHEERMRAQLREVIAKQQKEIEKDKEPLHDKNFKENT